MAFERLVSLTERWKFYLGVAANTWRADRRRGNAIKKRGVDELAFLPAALEVQESPPHPLGRIIAATVILFFLLAVLWASFGKIDIVAVAEGKIIPGGRVKTIQPMETAAIRKIHVVEGQAVHKGDVLIELDATQADADRRRMAREVLDASAALARLNEFSRFIEQPSADTPQLSLAQADAEIIAIHQALLEEQIFEYRARLDVFDRQLDRSRAEMAASEARLKKLEESLPFIEQRAKALEGLAAKKLAPQAQYLELAQELLEQRNDILYEKAHQAELREAERQIQAERAAYVQELQRSTRAEAASTEERLAAADAELTKAANRTAHQTLTAPVDGVVQQLAVHTEGGVVTPAQALMMIVPRDDVLEVEAWVQNQDIGFVEADQSAEVKIATFPFTRYGTIPAHVVAVSQDAVSDEEKGLLYSARVLLERSTMQVGEKLVNLTPGMAVSVEVKTGKRRLIEYFLSPLIQHGSEALRER